LSELTVEFAGEMRQVTSALTFGRTGDLCIDENDYMHRVVGDFFHDGSLWWLRNRGSRIPLTLVSNDGKRVQLPPGAVPLSGGGGIVRFQAGQTNYELSYSGSTAEPGPVAVAAADGDDGADQTLHLDFELTPREVDYLVCFCESQFGQTAARTLPSYAQVAQVFAPQD